jgi:hypothetical protein
MARIPRIPFHFHAEGHAFSGEFHEPPWCPIEAKASASLPTIGGLASARSEEFSFLEFVSFKKAQTHISGRKLADRVFHTHVTTSIEYLNIENVLTADRIVCRLNSIHDPEHPEGLILANGSRFENLQINGHKVEVVLRHNLLEDCHTFRGLHERVASEKKSRTIAKPESRVAICSLVERIESDLPFVPKGGGHVFEVPNFGQITIAEIFAEPGTRTLTMLHLELGSPQSSNQTVAEARTNGQPSPPTP